jgi:hypothetical protein
MKRGYDGSAVSAGMVIRPGDGSIYYDTNVVVKLSLDNGVTPIGSHGRYAKFYDIRSTTIVKDTGEYTVKLLRASIKSNSIPLFTPKPSAYVVENGKPMWEVTAQPGLSYTWTGPVYQANADSSTTGMIIGKDQLFASWPTYGAIPYFTYTATGVLSGATAAPTQGFIDCSAYVSENTLAATVASRLTSLFSAAGLSYVSVSVASSSASVTNVQQYSFTNSNASFAVCLDFTLPSGNAQKNTSSASHPAKAGILQACKILGFIPNQIFTIPPGGTATLTPRVYQMGFRSTLNLYVYKTVRWTPEDTASVIPLPNDVSVNDPAKSSPEKIGTYFDCYSYTHFLTQCVNPTFERCIYDAFDTAAPLSEQCLTRQLQTCCAANCVAYTTWSSSVSYAAGNAVSLNGKAYVAVFAALGANQAPGSIYWLSCGTSLPNSYDPTKTYNTGDIVTTWGGAGSANTIYFSFAQGVTTGAPTSSGATGNVNNWVMNPAFTVSNGIIPMNPAVATLSPTITYNPSLQSFSLNLDSYGFGGSSSANVDDGSYASVDDTLFTASAAQQYTNATLNDIARDSWGLTGIMPGTTTSAYYVARRPGLAFDERLLVEADDYFHQLFGNWPVLRLNYTDPNDNLTTSYVRYIPDAFSSGLTTQTLLPLSSTTPGSTGALSAYPPYGRVAGTVFYIYTVPQDYGSVGLAWNPFDAIVVTTNTVPIADDETQPPYVLNDQGVPQTQQSTGNTIKILADCNLKPLNQTTVGQEFRNEIVFDPEVSEPLHMTSLKDFRIFDWQLMLRLKGTQALRPLSLSNDGYAFLRFVFQRK